jgi:hypothetical protein
MTLLSGGAGAQVAFGVRAGGTYASLTQIVEEKVTYGGQLGFSVAGLIDIPVAPKFSVRPELALVNLGGAYYVEYRDDKQPQFDVERRKSNYYSLQIPVNFVYKIPVNDWQFCVYGGPSVSVSTQVREKEFDGERKFRSFDCGAGAGFSVRLQHVFSSVYMHSGFIDRRIRKESHESQLYQNSVTLSLGYWFR